MILSYTVWVFGILRLIPFSTTGIFFFLAVFFAVNLLIIFIQPKKEIKQKKGLLVFILIILGEEALFFTALFVWSFVKAHQPDINSLEKFMDFGFINSILRADYFPPLDMWLTKSPMYPHFFINYYYFGHLATAVLTKLSNLPAPVTYNLMLSTIFAFCFTGSFSLVINLLKHSGLVSLGKSKLFFVSRYVFFGLLAGFLTSLAGNLHTIYAFTPGYQPADKPIPFWDLIGKGINFTAYWYPNATRFIPFTIHEFPSYSFVVSDLHGHVLDIPFVLLTIALLLSFILRKRQNMETQKSKACLHGQVKSQNCNLKIKNVINFRFKVLILTFDFLLLTFLSLCLAVMYMTNAWDGLIYFVLSALVILYVYFEKFKQSFYSTLPHYLAAIIFLLALFIMFTLPFQLTFKPFVSGINFVKDRSPLWMLVILWGFFYYCSVGFLALERKTIFSTAGHFLSSIFPFLQKKKSFYFPYDSNGQMVSINIFIFLLIIVSTLLLIFPEILYVKDIYPQHYRANTMFKLGYQAYIMLSLVSAFTIAKCLLLYRKFRFKKFLPTFFIHAYYLYLLVFTFLVLLYPNFSVNTYFDRLKSYKGLDGTKYLQNSNQSDYEAISWFNKQVKEQPVVLEAVGDSYTEYSRFSAYTGLPTVLGWPVHEWLWRGSYDEPGKRVEEVKKAYLSQDAIETKAILNKYRVQYVVIGKLERQKYTGMKEEKWNKLGSVVFESGETKIYQITP